MLGGGDAAKGVVVVVGAKLGLLKPSPEENPPPLEVVPSTVEKPLSPPEETLLPASVVPPNAGEEDCEKGEEAVLEKAPGSPVAAELEGPAVAAESVKENSTAQRSFESKNELKEDKR